MQAGAQTWGQGAGQRRGSGVGGVTMSGGGVPGTSVGGAARKQ